MKELVAAVMLILSMRSRSLSVIFTALVQFCALMQFPHYAYAGPSCMSLFVNVTKLTANLERAGYDPLVAKRIVRKRPDVAEKIVRNPLAANSPVKLYRLIALRNLGAFETSTQRSTLGGYDRIFFGYTPIDSFEGAQLGSIFDFVMMEVEVPKFLIKIDRDHGFPVLLKSEVPDLAPFISKVGIASQDTFRKLGSKFRSTNDFDWTSLEDFQKAQSYWSRPARPWSENK